MMMRTNAQHVREYEESSAEPSESSSAERRRQSRQSRRRQSVIGRAVRVVVGRASSAEPSESSSAEPSESSFGIEVKHIKVHNKGYRNNKVMFVAVVAAASIGGYAHGACGMPLLIKRCCVREKAKKDSYKRYIDVDGNVSFPKTGPNAT
jgi:hypothetical protein